MPHMEELQRELRRIDGRPYPAYKDLRGSYEFDWGCLSIDHVQGDPFAAPSRLSIEIPHSETGIPESAYSKQARQTGAENFMARAFASACQAAAQSLGSGKSGLLRLDAPGPEVVRRTCCGIGPRSTILRFSAGLPANGRRISGRAAETLLLDAIPRAVAQSLAAGNLDLAGLTEAADANEDADELRNAVTAAGFLAFVADGAILPRASGVDERPLKGATAFTSPDAMRASFELPHAGKISGMGIKEGVTLVVGGGFHGKSTLLNAIERGVYNHRPGDGRELVVTRTDAVKVRAEDGRAVNQVDISAFLGNLPDGQDTRSFTTTNASGSTSQATAIVEALEAGSRLLLLDEDISATNFLIRDRRMRELVHGDHEPITPFVKRVRAMFENENISTIMVLGGSGDYFEPAHSIIAMEAYHARDVTSEAKAIAARYPDGNPPSSDGKAVTGAPRMVDPSSVDPFKAAAPYRGSRHGGGGSRPPRLHVRAHDIRGLSFGSQEIDLSLVAPLIDEAQVRAIGLALAHMSQHHFDGRSTLKQALEATMAELCEQGLELLCDGPPADLAEFRIFELAAALNRLRSLRTI